MNLKFEEEENLFAKKSPKLDKKEDNMPVIPKIPRDKEGLKKNLTNKERGNF